MSANGPIRTPQFLVVLCSCGVGVLAQNAKPPRFEDYPATELFTGTPAAPVLATAEQRMYRTRIRNGALPGIETTYGSWKNPVKHKGPNFAGHYFVIYWGCGSQCVMMATVDAKTGAVYDPPLSAVGSELYVPLDNLSEMEIDFRPDSSLLVLRNACRNFKNRKTCGTYYFNWKDNHFDLVKFVVMIDPQKELVP
jgi:hypothetical protein